MGYAKNTVLAYIQQKRIFAVRINGKYIVPKSELVAIKSLGETFTLTESGVYEVSIIAGGKTQKFTVTVDATAPTLVLNGVENGGSTTDIVILSDVSEDAEVKVFLNDEEIEYTVGGELSEVGEYKVVVTDTCGNATEYTFNIEKGANIVLWVILGIAGIGVGVFFFIKKKNSI